MASSADSNWTVIFNVPVSPFDLELEIDSGARCSIISKAVVQRFTSISPVHESNTDMNGLCGNPTKVYGEITLPCNYGTLLRNVTFKILDTPKHISLLGRPNCIHFNLIMRVNVVNSVYLSTMDLIQEFSDVVGDSMLSSRIRYRGPISRTCDSCTKTVASSNAR